MVDVSQLFLSVEEDDQPIEANVTGTIPAWLRGSFLRVGPGQFEVADFKLNNWIDGYSVLSTFNINEQGINFRRKLLRSDAHAKALKAKKPIYTEFATRNYPDPSKGFFSRIMSTVVPADLTDNANLNCFAMQGRLMAATQTCFLRVVDPHSLETKDKVDLSKNPGVHLATCHPHVGRDGTLFNVGCNFYNGFKYTVYKTPPCNDPESQLMAGTTVLGTVAPSWKANFGYFHSFGMSENYVVFIEQPILVNTLKLLASQVKGKSFKECLDWTPDEKVKFIVVDKTSGQKVRTNYVASTFFFLHHINAFEEDGHLIVDLIAFERPVFDKFSLKHLGCGHFEADDPPTPRRYVLPLPSMVDDSPLNKNMVSLNNCGATAVKQKENLVFVTPQNLFEAGSQAGFDLPKINYEKCNGRQYRYVYGTGFFEQQQTMNSLCKGDVKTRQIKTWSAGNGFYPGEPSFIAAPNATEEDDGVIVCGVCSGKTDQKDYMVVLDAKTFEELARATVPVRITLASHGLYIPRSDK